VSSGASRKTASYFFKDYRHSDLGLVKRQQNLAYSNSDFSNNQENSMTDEEVVDLLEMYWPLLPSRLAERWPNFLSVYRELAACLPLELDETEVTRIVDMVRELLGRFDCSVGKLQAAVARSEITSRSILDAYRPLPDEAPAARIANRLRRLADMPPVDQSPSGPSELLRENEERINDQGKGTSS
jgi:hypothetical protein